MAISKEALLQGRENIDRATAHGRDQTLWDFLITQRKKRGSPVGVVVNDSGYQFAIGKAEVEAITVFDHSMEPKKPAAVIGGVDVTEHAHPSAIERFHKNGGVPPSGLGSRSLLNAEKRAKAEKEAEEMKRSGKLKGGKQNRKEK